MTNNADFPHVAFLAFRLATAAAAPNTGPCNGCCQRRIRAFLRTDVYGRTPAAEWHPNPPPNRQDKSRSGQLPLGTRPDTQPEPPIDRSRAQAMFGAPECMCYPPQQLCMRLSTARRTRVHDGREHMGAISGGEERDELSLDLDSGLGRGARG